MRRRSRTKAEADEPRTDAESSSAESSAQDHDDFWSGASADADELVSAWFRHAGTCSIHAETGWSGVGAVPGEVDLARLVATEEMAEPGE